MSIPGRSWQRGEVTLNEIRELVKPFATAVFDDEAMEDCDYDVVVHDGPLLIDGDFDTLEHELSGLVVRGDFTVRGHYADCDDPSTGVYVLGDMSSGSVVTRGALGVTGSLVSAGPVAGFHNDFSANIRGNVRTPCLVSPDHRFKIGGRLIAERAIGDAVSRLSGAARGETPILPPSRYRELLVAEVLAHRGDADPELDENKLRQQIASGRPVLR